MCLILFGVLFAITSYLGDFKLKKGQEIIRTLLRIYGCVWSNLTIGECLKRNALLEGHYDV